MFAIDTGATEGGAKGPWISFTAKGSATHGLRPESWKLRTKTENGSTTAAFPPMTESGVVLDIYAQGGHLQGTLKLGHMKDGETMPERRWWPSALHSQARPDESKSEGGGFAWRNALSVRVATSPTETATWEDAGWGVYLGFSNAIKNLINPGFAANIGKCPMIRCIGYVKQGSGQKATSIPQFEIVKWVDRPACLVEDAPQIALAPAPVAPPAPPQPVSAGDVGF
jgi:hypothetical protein